MSTKQRLSDFNRTNILEAAKMLFITRGINQTTMDDIAKAADYSKSTIYVYFKSKDEIYHYLILEHFELLKSEMEKALKGNLDFNSGYFAICDTLVDLQEKHPLFFESIMGEIKMPKDENDTVLIKIYQVGEEINDILLTFLKTHIESGRVNLDMSVLQLTLTLQASICAIILMADKKEAYLNKAGISKNQFKQDGFKFLLKSLSGKEN